MAGLGGIRPQYSSLGSLRQFPFHGRAGVPTATVGTLREGGGGPTRVCLPLQEDVVEGRCFSPPLLCADPTLRQPLQEGGPKLPAGTEGMAGNSGPSPPSGLEKAGVKVCQPISN